MVQGEQFGAGAVETGDVQDAAAPGLRHHAPPLQLFDHALA
jgi:hypothetical protein